MTIPGISSVYMIPTEALPAFCEVAAMFNQRVAIFTQLTKIPLAPDATVRAEDESAAEGAARKATLQFKAERVPFSVHDRVAFVIFTADGDQFLLGTKEPPFPKLKITDDRSTPSKGEAGVSVTVEWNGALMPCFTLYSSFGTPKD